MRGWEVRSIPGLRAFHLRPNGMAGSILWYSYRPGLADDPLRTHPLFVLAKVAPRLPSKPIVLYGMAELVGFIQADFKSDKRVAIDKVVEFLSKQQIGSLMLRN